MAETSAVVPDSMGSMETTGSMEEILVSGGGMGRLIASTDWSLTALGPIPEWPQSLRAGLGICLLSRFPMVLWWGQDLRMLYNDGYREILGDDKHPAALGARGEEVWAELWDVIGPQLQTVRNGGDSTYTQNQRRLVPCEDGAVERYHTLSHSAVYDERGGIGGVLSVVFDTTDQVIGQRRLVALRTLAAETAEAASAEEVCERAATALEGSPEELPFALLYLLENDGTIARLAGAAGIRASKSPVEAMVTLDRDTSGWRLAEAGSTGNTVDIDVLPTRRACDRVLVLPLQQSEGLAPEGFLVAGISSGCAFDTGYRDFCGQVAQHVASAVAKTRMEEAERRAEALAELNRARTAFFGNVSHEFRTPLTLLLGPIEDTLADVEHPLSQRQRERLEIAQRNAVRMLGLVNTLLDFSKLEEGQLRASYEPINLGALTSEVASVFRSGVERAGLRLSVECAECEPVHVDRAMWEKIVINLLSNALKFTLSGQIAVRLERRGNCAVLEVSDTGIGIPQDEVPRIFDRFHRVRAPRCRTHEGTGIGLALVHELVKLHHGTITVRTVVGEGSCFTVTVPFGTAHLPADRLRAPSERGGARPLAQVLAEVHAEEAARRLPGTDAVTGAGGTRETRGRILVVDDNADMRRYVGRLLSAHWEVEAAADGLAALAAARRQAPDLVLTDVMMPGLDGFALLRALRGDPGTSRVPVVMVSARAGEEAAIEGLDAGADDYLVKPFSARELVARVRVNLEMARAREAAARRADEHARVLSGLADAATVLTSAASLDSVLREVTEQARDLIGAHQSVTSMTVDHNWAQAITFVSLSDKYAAFQGYDELPDGSGIYSSVCRHNSPMRLTHAELTSHPAWRGFGKSADRHPPMRGWLAAPLTSRDGKNLGLLQLSDKYEGDFTDQDLAILTQLAAIAAARIERAQVEDRVRQVSEILQHSLLPSRMPKLDNARVAARYLPGSRDIDIGGDWYDVVAMPGERLLLAIGDVVGHGERAAAAMGQLRNAVRAYAWEGLSPSAVLQRLNRLGEALGEQHFSTAVCMCFDPRTGLLRYANAGHPPPVVVNPDGKTRLLEGARGVPIGAVGHSSYVEVETSLEAGSTLMLYTDGLVESRTRGLDQGLADLDVALADGPGDLEELLDHVVATVPDKTRDDDLALVGLRVLHRPVTNLALRLPAVPDALALLRSQARGFLEQAGVPSDDVYELIVALGEAAANAIQHPVAPSQPFFEVSLTASATEVTGTVRDFGRWESNSKADDRGRGLPFMAALAEVGITEHPDGTTVSLQRTLRERL